MTRTHPPLTDAACLALDDHRFVAGPLTRGPWDPSQQHAGPPIAMVCRAIERTAAEHGLPHIARLTANLLRPVPIGELSVEVMTDYAGRNAGHFSAHLMAGGKEIARCTALAQREVPMVLPDALPGHPLPRAPRPPEDSPEQHFPWETAEPGYAHLVETRGARGRVWDGPSAIWFRMRYPLLRGEETSPYQRVLVAADSSSGVSAILDENRHTFVNSDLTINLLRRPVGEWVCLDARTLLGPNGGGLAESVLYDVDGLIGRATQSLAIRAR